MNITILTYGSRGDVQPFLALGVGLQKAGHAVTLAAPHRFADFIEQRGISCAPLAGDPDELSRLFNNAGNHYFQMIQSMQKHVLHIAPEVVKSARQALQKADLVIHSFAFTTGGHSFAREFNIPDVSVQMFPIFAPTRSFAAIGMPETKLGWVNWLGHWISTKVFWHAGNAGYYRLRRSGPHDFPARLSWPFTPTKNRLITPLIFACSRYVLSNPDNWDKPHIHLPGYFFLDDPEYVPPDELSRFLEAGEPPFCITFGSMVNRDAERISQESLKAIKYTHKRAIVLTGWGDWRQGAQQDDVLFLESAPHDWLFPRCRMVIHHGGAGTTAAVLRAGVPSIVVPHTADQSFWGNRVTSIGAGTRSIPVRRLTMEKLSTAITETGTETFRRAAEIGCLIRAEDGVSQAVSLIEHHAIQFSIYDNSPAGYTNHSPNR